MSQKYLVITTIADQDHIVLKQYAHESHQNGFNFVAIGDTKSPAEFALKGCRFYPVQVQKKLTYNLAELLPLNHYSRKNLGYLIAMSEGAKIILETDDDNIPLSGFWNKRTVNVRAHTLVNSGWINVYRYFTVKNIWPRGFPLTHVHDSMPSLNGLENVICPVQQGLADDNPDVDAIYRLTMPLPVVFNKSENIALGNGSICPFNSQDTTWFKMAFPLMYLPSYCSFRMTDIWRSFVAQRIAWSSGWHILFHQSTTRQERNDHNLMKDFQDEIPGYLHNSSIMASLVNLELKEGPENISHNMLLCYGKLIESNWMDKAELPLLKAWLDDVKSIGNN